MKLPLANGVARNSRIIADNALGSWVYTRNQKKIIDMTSGIGALSTGHSHPHIIHRVSNQLRKMVHAQQNCLYSHPSQIELMTRLNHITPSSMDTFFFTNSGSEAIENSIKLARKATGKPNIITCLGGFHGRTLGCMSLSSSKTSCKKGYQPLMPGVFYVDFPFEKNNSNYDSSWHNKLDSIIERATDPDETAAILIEPVLGEGGVVRADINHMRYLRNFCDQHDILWISDEVQTGMGRTGYWWGYEHFSVNPDIITFGKGIASGFPLAGVIGREEHFNQIHTNGLGGTYNGNLLAVEAANATLDIFQDEYLVETTDRKGRYLVDKIKYHQFDQVESIRQYGLMIAIELNLPNQESFTKLMSTAPDHDILLLSTGVNNTIRLLPPLTISFKEIDIFVERFSNLLDKLN